MNGSIDFAVAWWWFPLLLAPGLWLTVRLYVRPPVRYPVLAALHAVAWSLLAWWAVAPVWRSHPEIWHPPLVVLAVDAGPGYAALGARDSGQGARRAARAHYEGLGVRVIETDVVDQLPGGDGYPNLQAVLLWSDARSPDLAVARTAAPVFPVMTRTATGEVQGESAYVALREEGEREAAALTVAWRALGNRPAHARAALQVGDTVVWSGILMHPPAAQAGGRVMSDVTLTERALDAVRRNGSALRLVVRPVEVHDNAFSANDTVSVDASRVRRALQAFIRPVTTLQERGLMDALRDEPGFRVDAMPAGGMGTMTGGADRAVVWLPAGRAVPRAPDSVGFAGGAARVIRYHIAVQPEDPRGVKTFGADARIERAADLAAFLPAGVLRLADLGFTTADRVDSGGRWVLPAVNGNVEPLAWAVQDGRRGLLFWRDRRVRIGASYGFVAPPIWTLRFRPESGARGAGGASAAQAEAWARGAAWWVLADHGAARDSGSRPSGEGASPARAAPSLARLGTDVEALTRLAARHGGRVLPERDARVLDPPVRERAGRAEGGETESPWPVVPGGQVRETRARAVPLAPPFGTVGGLVLALGGLWLGRKRRQLD